MIPFKPGEKVRRKAGETRTVSDVETNGSGQAVLHLTGYGFEFADEYELAEPSIPISKLREVCLRRLCNANWPAHKLLIRSLFKELTGEHL